MAKIVAICNQKGGVGKSTTAVNVGAYISIAGKRTLIVDLDAQGNATISCGIDRTRIRKTMYEAITVGGTVDDLIMKSPVEFLDVAPSSVELYTVDLFIAGVPDKERVLTKIFDAFRQTYDVILLDCPPSLGLLTINALVASDGVLIPVQCEYLALEGLNALLKTVNRVKSSWNPGLQITGIVLTMADFRTTLTQEVAGEVKRFFNHLVLDTAIPRNVRLAESPSFGRPICMYDPNSAGALAYENLAKEVMAKLFTDVHNGDPGLHHNAENPRRS